MTEPTASERRTPNAERSPRSPRLGIGFVGSGFVARFHIQSMIGVRDADVAGVFSPTRAHAETAAALASDLGVGDARVHGSVTDLVADPNVDAIWICTPNDTRIAVVEEIVAAIRDGRGELRGVACEKPLARNAAEARRMVELIESTPLLHGYLENQVFAPSVQRGKELVWRRAAPIAGRPYLARAAEEHSGPHMPWFWSGERQGGGVLNDMMCHSALVVRHLLTKPGQPLSTVRPVRVSAHIASLKWSRPEYVKILKKTMGNDVDYSRHPSEDFASARIEFETDDGHVVLGEATTSWSFVGAGLRLSAELLGPEYSMSWNSLDSGLNLFFSRAVEGKAGEDLVEKQNAEVGLMPVVANESAVYGYDAEDRHFARVFLGKEKALLDFDDGLEVVQMLMTLYQSAEQGKTLDFPPRGLDKFVPAVARGDWKPAQVG